MTICTLVAFQNLHFSSTVKIVLSLCFWRSGRRNEIGLLSFWWFETFERWIYCSWGWIWCRIGFLPSKLSWSTFLCYLYQGKHPWCMRDASLFAEDDFQNWKNQHFWRTQSLDHWSHFAWSWSSFASLKWSRVSQESRIKSYLRLLIDLGLLMALECRGLFGRRSIN